MCGSIGNRTKATSCSMRQSPMLLLPNLCVGVTPEKSLFHPRHPRNPRLENGPRISRIMRISHIAVNSSARISRFAFPSLLNRNRVIHSCLEFRREGEPGFCCPGEQQIVGRKIFRAEKFGGNLRTERPSLVGGPAEEFPIAWRFVRDLFFRPEIFLPILPPACNITAASGASVADHQRWLHGMALDISRPTSFAIIHPSECSSVSRG